MTYLLPGMRLMSFDVTAQQMNVRIAITGIANATGIKGSAWFPLTKKLAIGARKNICIRYIPNESLEMPVMIAGAFV